VETHIANQFMAYLATCLGAIPELDATPVTNKAPIISALKPSHTQPTHLLHHNKSRSVVLENLFPIPRETVPIDKLLRFKQRHGHLLPSLRVSVEAHCTYVSTLQKAEQRIEANKAFLLECAHLIAEIEEAIRPTFGKVVLGCFAPMLSATLAIRAVESNDVASYTIAISSLAGAAYSAIGSIQGGHVIRNRPLAYAFYARRTLTR
ncbi:hypothetical protein ACQV5M_19000, partial [Leptospira sp. SA-E8]|uniref:hypothetical protein n=1 Tax=Leptospira sp. SA-E8 TaxID=3422259 RepID=UPI003EBC555E